VAVAALNPHGGENGLCGDEELTIIGPGVKQAQEAASRGGPYPADTIFMRAQRGDFRGVVIMYHDQGRSPQAAGLRPRGNGGGRHIAGGHTPAHGTAFDIAGKGIANPAPSRRR